MLWVFLGLRIYLFDSKYIVNVGEEEGLYHWHRGDLPYWARVLQYRCMNLPKTDNNHRTHTEMMQTPILTYGQCFFPETSAS